MTELIIDSNDLQLVLQGPAETHQMLNELTPEQRAEISPAWLNLVASATGPDPWIHGFRIVRKSDGQKVGSCGFKGPPTSDRIVEIAYGIDPEFQGRGYATAVAQAQTDYAFATGQVRLVCAHTSPEPNASTRVLTKCGFTHIGQVIDPDDGPVWRWEKHLREA